MSDNSEISRRKFLETLAKPLVAVPLVAAPLVAAVASCGDSSNKSAGLIGLGRKTDRVVQGAFVDDDMDTGHKLRDGASFAGAREQRSVAVAIVGGGMGGLSAGWRLDKLGMRDWLLLELGEHAGGNSRGGENEVSRYPWGAHYVPVPGENAVHVRELFREMGVLDANGVWDERTLCHTPQERIWQHGRWHEGVEPLDGLRALDRSQFQLFEERIADFRNTGAFRVPMGDVRFESLNARVQKQLQELDAQTAENWMSSLGLDGDPVRWWVEYGTRDDYGASLKQASAWAAVHYFAARDADEQGPLTWPEGNHFIVKHLLSRGGDRVITGAPAYRVERKGTKWLVRTPKLDVTCDAVVWAAPLFIMPRVVEGVQLPTTPEYAPWVVANVTIENWPAERGAPPAWDNVIYDSDALGYVVATHQNLGETGPRSVWTWYHAVVDRSAADGRKMLSERPWEFWRDYILDDLAKAHPDIRSVVSRIDVRRWGHAMSRPTPGVLHRVRMLRDWKPAERLFVAHADMSGLSLFEEAQWHGVRAADSVIGLGIG